ncbi:MAG: murein biosynthesis integral membrane protein MurJ [Luteolibacter sp.]
MSAKNTLKVSVAVMASRVLGLVREMVFAGLFGGTRWTDCFVLAYKVPNLLRDLFAEGALSQAFVTTFSKTLKTDGDASAWQLANRVMTLAAIFMGFITLVGILIAPWIIELLMLLTRSDATGRSYNPEEVAFTVTMVRVMYPYILLVSMSALVMGMLNAKSIFFMPALSSCFFNLGSILGGIGIGWWLDPEWGPRSLLGFSIGVVIGGIAQLTCQFPALLRAGFRFVADFHWSDTRVAKILSLMLPAVIAASVVQVNVMINAMFAFGVGEGAASWLNYAFRLMQLPLGVFGVAVATVTLPSLSRAAIHGISPDFKPILAKGLRLVTFLVLPSMLGLICLAEPIISVIYERGNFTDETRRQTAIALQAYGCGLLFYAALKVVQPAFYAIDRRWLPMISSIIALILNIGFNYFFVFVLGYGHAALALTTSITATANFLFLYLAMRHFAGDFDTLGLLRMLGKLLVAAGVMSAICLAGKAWLMPDPGALAWPVRATSLAAVIGVAAVAYLGIARVLRVEEVRETLGLLHLGGKSRSK